MDARRGLEILFRDSYLAAVHKPSGLVVHRTGCRAGEDAALQMLRGQLGCRVYPVHRLDRATSGVLVFALSPEVAGELCSQLRREAMNKTYLAVARGFVPEEGVIDYPLSREGNKPPLPAQTVFRRLDTVTLPIAVGRYSHARYSLVEIRPKSGRRHQIRRHFAHLRHPLVGDTVHGDGRHNRMFREQFGVRRLLLMATRISFPHPVGGMPLDIQAPPGPEIEILFQKLGWTVPRHEGWSAP